MQIEEPVEDWARPKTHNAQFVESSEAAKVPTGQEVHVADAGSIVIAPAPHLMHWFALAEEY
jgi:hypothetical protein